MKNKLILVTAMIFTVFSLNGCSVSEEGSSNLDSDLSQPTMTDVSSNSESMNQDVSDDQMIDSQITFADGYVLNDFESRYSEAGSLYPDKTVLVWACDEDIRYEEELNTYLNENNYPFVIVF
ncbi:MAG: hypothetical protein PUA81_08390, partial [Oscillospiraceae bacterium]|nr:hypothetical protein [Oscillospiraceae bacterium]